MKDELRLRDATAQEIQLELIRRTTFNAFDGERIYFSLLKHRELWEAVTFGRLVAREQRTLPGGSQIPLRDLSSNDWNADTLYILTPSVAAARALEKVHDSEAWCGEIYVFDNPKDVDNALGGPDFGRAIVRVWWD